LDGGSSGRLPRSARAYIQFEETRLEEARKARFFNEIDPL